MSNTRNMNPNSIESYINIIMPSLTERQAMLIKTFRHVPNMTGKEYARRLGVGVNEVSGRFTELRNKNIIRDSGIKREKYTVWELSNDPQLSMFGAEVQNASGVDYD